MPEPRVVWIDFPPELRALCEPYLMREIELVPRWVVEIRVQHDAAGGQAAMMTRVDHEYRCGTIWFAGQWFCGNDQYRRSSIRHEIVVHFALEPLAHFTRQLVGTFSEDKRHHAHLTEQMRQVLEMAACDVEEALNIALAIDPCDNDSALAAKLRSHGARP